MKILMRVVLPIVMSLCAVSAWAQSLSTQTAPSASWGGAATGKVIGPDAAPQVGVPVIVSGPAGVTHAFTDAKGNWSVYNLAPGDYQVKPALKAAGEASVNFSVKDRGLIGRLLGSETDITTSAMRLNHDFQQ